MAIDDDYWNNPWFPAERKATDVIGELVSKRIDEDVPAGKSTYNMALTLLKEAITELEKERRN